MGSSIISEDDFENVLNKKEINQCRNIQFGVYFIYLLFAGFSYIYMNNYW
jgi:hypothetical protein